MALKTRLAARRAPVAAGPVSVQRGLGSSGLGWNTDLREGPRARRHRGLHRIRRDAALRRLLSASTLTCAGEGNRVGAAHLRRPRAICTVASLARCLVPRMGPAPSDPVGVCLASSDDCAGAARRGSERRQQQLGSDARPVGHRGRSRRGVSGACLSRSRPGPVRRRALRPFAQPGLAKRRLSPLASTPMAARRRHGCRAGASIGGARGGHESPGRDAERTDRGRDRPAATGGCEIRNSRTAATRRARLVCGDGAARRRCRPRRGSLARRKMNREIEPSHLQALLRQRRRGSDRRA